MAAAVLVLAAAVVFAAEPVPHAALLNGDFAAGLDSGWTRQFKDVAGYHEFKPLEAGGVRVAMVQCGYARLVQEVSVASLDQDLSARVRFHAEANKPGYSSLAALTCRYLDATGKELGLTRYLVRAGAAAPKSTTTAHYVTVKPDTWQDLKVNLAAEVAGHLSGVPAGKVKRLRLEFESYNSGTSSC